MHVHVWLKIYWKKSRLIFSKHKCQRRFFLYFYQLFIFYTDHRRRGLHRNIEKRNIIVMYCDWYLPWNELSTVSGNMSLLWLRKSKLRWAERLGNGCYTLKDSTHTVRTIYVVSLCTDNSWTPYSEIHTELRTKLHQYHFNFNRMKAKHQIIDNTIQS